MRTLPALALAVCAGLASSARATSYTTQTIPDVLNNRTQHTPSVTVGTSPDGHTAIHAVYGGSDGGGTSVEHVALVHAWSVDGAPFTSEEIVHYAEFNGTGMYFAQAGYGGGYATVKLDAAFQPEVMFQGGYAVTRYVKTIFGTDQYTENIDPQVHNNGPNYAATSLSFVTTPEIAMGYSNVQDNTIRFTHLVNGVWKSETVTSDAAGANGLTLAYDGANNAHIAWLDGGHYVKYADRWSNGSWSVRTVGQLGWANTHTPGLSMAIDSLNTPHIVTYDDEWNGFGNLQHWWLNNANTFVSETITGYASSPPSLAAGTDGSLTVAYERFVSAVGWQLVVSTHAWAATHWNTQILSTNQTHGAPSLALDSAGYPVVAFIAADTGKVTVMHGGPTILYPQPCCVFQVGP
ncbi:MAG: hypothetical protein JST92_16690 [Deltaproteobacteria bacterium]|nr:hypothetical protein [Deltaproteobacteria bacterium]